MLFCARKLAKMSQFPKGRQIQGIKTIFFKTEELIKGRVKKIVEFSTKGGGVSDGRFSTKKKTKQKKHGLKTLDFA